MWMFGTQYYKIFFTTLPYFEMFIERVYVNEPLNTVLDFNLCPNLTFKMYHVMPPEVA